MPFVVPESEIRQYVESLGIHDTDTVAAGFQIVADLTKDAVARLDPSALRCIKRLVREANSKHYRLVMEAIILSAGQGSRGVNAAHLTASVAVQMIFRWSPEYFSAFEPLSRRFEKEVTHVQVIRATNFLTLNLKQAHALRGPTLAGHYY